MPTYTCEALVLLLVTCICSVIAALFACVVVVVVFVRGLLCIHPSFRIIALAEPPVVGSSSQQWLNAEQLTVFLYHNMRSLSVAEELHVLNKLVSERTHVACFQLC